MTAKLAAKLLLVKTKSVKSHVLCIITDTNNVKDFLNLQANKST